ncbi:hypothetical protein Anapl_16355 [Anas platyrhynchos]|uniref:Uncharacterized protein n=1 Tax=Anas platyrhynchos TaxID=8839 RepID=R0KYG2_ANAPL|nr:hypothetical protein Anapl_16355 [Anas platyrhynchos]
MQGSEALLSQLPTTSAMLIIFFQKPGSVCRVLQRAGILGNFAVCFEACNQLTNKEKVTVIQFIEPRNVLSDNNPDRHFNSSAYLYDRCTSVGENTVWNSFWIFLPAKELKELWNYFHTVQKKSIIPTTTLHIGAGSGAPGMKETSSREKEAHAQLIADQGHPAAAARLTAAARGVFCRCEGELMAALGSPANVLEGAPSPQREQSQKPGPLTVTQSGAPLLLQPLLQQASHEILATGKSQAATDELIPELLAPLFLNLRTERQPVVSMSPLSGQSTHPEVEDVVKPLEEKVLVRFAAAITGYCSCASAVWMLHVSKEQVLSRVPTPAIKNRKANSKKTGGRWDAATLQQADTNTETFWTADQCLILPLSCLPSPEAWRGVTSVLTSRLVSAAAGVHQASHVCFTCLARLLHGEELLLPQQNGILLLAGITNGRMARGKNKSKELI